MTASLCTEECSAETTNQVDQTEKIKQNRNYFCLDILIQQHRQLLGPIFVCGRWWWSHSCVSYDFLLSAHLCCQCAASLLCSTPQLSHICLVSAISPAASSPLGGLDCISVICFRPPLVCACSPVPVCCLCAPFVPCGFLVCLEFLCYLLLLLYSFLSFGCPPFCYLPFGL